MSLMLFEDNEKSPISELLKCLFIESNVDFVEFAGTNENLYKRLKAVYKPGLIHYVFIDMSPDNSNTKTAYTNFVNNIREKPLSNVWLIPIPCIEFYVIKAFPEDCKSVTDVLNFNEYTRTKRCKSFESNCKRVLNTDIENFIKNNCMVNESDFSHHRDFGYFYKEDCPCSNSAGCDKKMERELKAYKLWKELPVTILKSDAGYYFSPDDDPIEICRSQVTKYNNFVDRYLELRMISADEAVSNKVMCIGYT